MIVNQWNFASWCGWEVYDADLDAEKLRQPYFGSTQPPKAQVKESVI